MSKVTRMDLIEIRQADAQNRMDMDALEVERHMMRVHRLVEFELGILLALATVYGQGQLSLTEKRAWLAPGACEPPALEKLLSETALGFVPEPGYAPTERLLKSLRGSGFGAESAYMPCRSNLPPQQCLVVSW